MRPPLVLLALFALGISARASGQPLVYVRCPRSDAPLEISATVTVAGASRRVSRTFRGIDGADVLPDVTHFFGGFSAPCDLVYRATDGSERALYDCTSISTDEDSCAAMDPAVSFDGRTVAFTVFRGPLSRPRFRLGQRVFDPDADEGLASDVNPAEIPSARLDSVEAQLHLVDVATGEVTPLPYVEGQFDTGPAFLADGRLAFTSTRDGNFTTNVWGSTSLTRGTRIWTMDVDGRNVDLASHHSLSQEQHPFPLRDGRLVYSSWQVLAGLPFRHTNGSPGRFTTLGNLFHLFTQRPDGSLNFAFYGQHSGDHQPSYFGEDHDAAHFITQAGDGRVWFADYYRGNNNGLGVVIGVMPEPEGQEGIAPEDAERRADIFAPRDAARLTNWATNGDGFSNRNVDMPVNAPAYADPIPFMGKVGHPAALPDGQLLVAYGLGPCSTVVGNRIFSDLGREAPPLTSGSGQGTYINVITSLGLDIPACDVGIYRTTTIPSGHPNDLEAVVNTRAYHEFMARPVVPYAAIHGVEAPSRIAAADQATSHALLEAGTPFGLLGAASIVDRETHPRDGIHFMGEHQFHLQGTDTIDYDDDELCGVRMLGLMPNRAGRRDEAIRDVSNLFGERVTILGEIPVRKRDEAGEPVRLADGTEDTSFLLRMPANVPYLMQGIDCDGRTLNTDQSWQQLRPGEMKTCGGCHVHSRPARHAFSETFAATSDYEVPRLGEGRVPLLAGRDATGAVQSRSVEGYDLQVEYERDIFPIFQSRCATRGCHGGDSPAAGLSLDRPGREAPSDGSAASTWWCLVADRHQACVPEARRHRTGVRGGFTFRRPQMTKYVRAFNARGSLLYWKAAGERTDNRSDDLFGPDASDEDRDIDYGPAHPETGITPEELGLLSRWIDLGNPSGGATELRDTQKPTLHLVGIAEGEAIVELRVGTADLGDGIDPSSLEVCVLDPAEECEDLSGDAADPGVVSVPLPSSLTDPDQEIRARVLDRAGNETVVRRTVGWLLHAPPPMLPAAADAGSSADAGSDDGGVHGGRSGSGGSGGCGCRVGVGVLSPVSWVALALFGLLLGWRRQGPRRRWIRGAGPAEQDRGT